MRRVTNHPLSLPLEVDLGEIEGTTHFDLEVMNVGEVSVTIVGDMSGCDCLVPSNVPLTIEPNDKKFLEFDFDPKRVDDSGTTRLALKLQLLTTTATALPAITVFATFVHNSSVDSELNTRYRWSEVMAISRRSGTSLVELLVVMGIFSLLISLLFPAVQSTREAARRHHCQNNLRQVALANLAYESAHNSFPPGTSDQRPIRTWGTTAILPPYLESVAFTADDLQGDCEERIRNDDRVRTMSQQPIPQYGCPSDPRANRVGSFIYGLPQVGPQLPLVSYVGVAGDHLPGSFTGDAGGMFFSRSAIRLREITDGTSHTLLFGEREIRYEGSGDGTSFTFALCYCNGQTHFQFQSADHRLNSDFVRGPSRAPILAVFILPLSMVTSRFCLTIPT